MLLTPMRYKQYVWPHNPEVYEVERQRRLVVHPVPFGGCVVQDLGQGCRVLRGRGTFAGPEAYEQFRRLAAVFQEGGPGPVPFGGCVVQDLGQGCRVLRGRGTFAGPEAYEQFRRLAAVFQEGGPGLLVHPIWQTERAWFASLTVEEEPTPDYVRYRFAFWEDGAAGEVTEIPAPERPQQRPEAESGGRRGGRSGGRGDGDPGAGTSPAAARS